MPGRTQSNETTPPAQELLEHARGAAEAAGRLLLERLTTGITGVEAKSSPTDLVSDVDRASESLIRRLLRDARPSDAFIGEEGGEDIGQLRGAPSTVRWVVDPLDGTVNYLYRFPAFSVSVAAEVDGQVVAGVVHDPLRGETFGATRNGGAFCHATTGTSEGLPVPLSASRADRIDMALIGTGFAYDAEVRRRQGRIVAHVLPAVRDIRRAGSAALDLCWVAAGRLDGYYEEGTHHWDRAAGALIASEAGAWVGGLDGGPATDAMSVAAAPGIAAALIDLIVGAAGSPARA